MSKVGCGSSSLKVVLAHLDLDHGHSWISRRVLPNLHLARLLPGPSRLQQGEAITTEDLVAAGVVLPPVARLLPAWHPQEWLVPLLAVLA